MYCIKCGTELAEGSAFCTFCGTKQTVTVEPVIPEAASAIPENITPVIPDPEPAIQPAADMPAPVSAENVSADGTSAVQNGNMKKAMIVLAVLIVLGVLAGMLMFFLNKNEKPGTEIVNAVKATEKADSFKTDITIDLNANGIQKLSGSDAKISNNALMSIVGSSLLKTDAQFYLKGEGEDFKMRIVFSNAIQMLMDNDGISTRLSASGLGAIIGGTSDEDRTETRKFDDGNRQLFDMLASRDMIGYISDNSELESEVKKGIKNYDKIPDVFEKMLNEKDADYIESYEKKDGAYTYTIDVMKFIDAFLDNEELGVSSKLKKEFSEELKSIKEKYTYSAVVSVSVRSDKLEKAVIVLKADKTEIGTITAEFSEYGDIKDSDLEMQKLKGKASGLGSVLAPSMTNYVSKSKQMNANSNAKMLFSRVATELADLMSEGKDFPTGHFTFKIEDANKSDPIAAYIYDNFSYLEDEMGEVYYVIDKEGNIEFAQWRKNSNSVIGQYPHPIDADDSSSAVWGELNQ